MRENLLEMGAQLLLIVVYGIGALIAGIAGLIIEYSSLGYFLSGEYQMGIWVGVIGFVALAVAYLLITDKLWALVAPMLTGLTDRAF